MFTISKALKRRSLLVVVLALAVGFAVPAAASASTAGTEAATWLGTQLKPTSASSPAYCELYGEASVGETIECMLAFKAAGSAFDSEREATYNYVLANKSAYVGSEPCATASELSAGAVAKLALAVEAAGGNPEDVEGRDLISDLECLQDSASEAGRFSDKGPENYSNTTTQSLAIIALKACEQGDYCPTKSGLSSYIAAGAAYLRAQQCAGGEAALDGAFRSTMGLEPDECNNEAPFPEGEPENTNAVEVDSTGAAVQALLADGTPESVTAADAGLAWLEGNSLSSAGSPPGRFWENYCSISEPTTIFPSVNSTALASMAYVEDGLSIAEPQAWLTAAVNSGSNRGLPACGATGNGDVLATAQGIFGLEGTSYPQLVGLPLG